MGCNHRAGPGDTFGWPWRPSGTPWWPPWGGIWLLPGPTKGDLWVALKSLGLGLVATSPGQPQREVWVTLGTAGEGLVALVSYLRPGGWAGGCQGGRGAGWASRVTPTTGTRGHTGPPAAPPAAVPPPPPSPAPGTPRGSGTGGGTPSSPGSWPAVGTGGAWGHPELTCHHPGPATSSQVPSFCLCHSPVPPPLTLPPSQVSPPWPCCPLLVRTPCPCSPPPPRCH